LPQLVLVDGGTGEVARQVFEELGLDPGAGRRRQARRKVGLEELVYPDYRPALVLDSQR
jgi:excinuclease UvrABC nuclease subunit